MLSSPALPSSAPRARPPVPRTCRTSVAPFCAGGAEARVRDDLDGISAAVCAALRSELVALLLVGGYARGEGGSVEGPGGFAPYNDYDLVAVVRGRPAAVRPRIAAIEAQWTAALGVHVDIWPAGEDLVAAPPATLFWLDVALGGARVLAGDPRVLDGARRLRPRAVPLSEAGRLLSNRAVGLALSNLAPGFDPAALRHVHKAVLAVGDARLLAADRYRGTVRDRLAELRRLEAAPGIGEELVRRYAEAAAFRERPDRFRPAAGEDPQDFYARALERIGRWHLELEGMRVGTPGDALGYATFPGRIFADLPDVSPARAVASTLRTAVKLRLPLAPWVGHPRERLARAAVALAYGADSAAARGQAALLLGLPREAPSTDEDLRAALLELIPLGG